MYAEVLALIARAIAKNHGFVFPESIDILRHESARAYLYTSDAEIALEVIDQYLGQNKIEFKDLEVADGYIMPALNTASVLTDPLKLTWEAVDQLVENMYKVWGVTRSERSTLDQYETDRLNAIDDHYTHAQLIEIYERLIATTIRPCYAPKKDKARLGKAIFDMLNPYKDWLKLKLYFDAEFVCIGAEACDRWATYYQTSDRKIQHERQIMIKAGYNPLNRVLFDILQENTDEAFKLDTTPPAPEVTPAPAPAPAPAPEAKQHGPRYKDAKPAPELPEDFFLFCTKAEKTLYQTSFVGLEKVFQEFLVVKKELAAINITVGKMTASQSSCKSWNVNGGEAGKGKTALFWDANGWQFGPRTVDGELPEGIEGWDLMEHLADNNAEANNIHAAHWYDAIDEDAEAEAIELQKQEAAAKRH